jgi:hypothetical protein
VAEGTMLATLLDRHSCDIFECPMFDGMDWNENAAGRTRRRVAVLLPAPELRDY